MSRSSESLPNGRRMPGDLGRRGSGGDTRRPPNDSPWTARDLVHPGERNKPDAEFDADADDD